MVDRTHRQRYCPAGIPGWERRHVHAEGEDSPWPDVPLCVGQAVGSHDEDAGRIRDLFDGWAVDWAIVTHKRRATIPSANSRSTGSAQGGILNPLFNPPRVRPKFTLWKPCYDRIVVRPVVGGWRRVLRSRALGPIHAASGAGPLFHGSGHALEDTSVAPSAAALESDVCSSCDCFFPVSMFLQRHAAICGLLAPGTTAPLCHRHRSRRVRQPRASQKSRLGVGRFPTRSTVSRRAFN